MKCQKQLDAIRSIRKTVTPPSRVQRPNKGGGYRRNKSKETACDDW